MIKFYNYLIARRQVRELVQLLQLLEPDPDQQELYQGFLERAGKYADAIRGAAFLGLIDKQQTKKLLNKLSTVCPQSYPQ